MEVVAACGNDAEELRGGPFKRCVSTEEDVHNDTNAPIVDPLVVGLDQRDFRSNVVGRATICRKGVGALDFLGESKVCNLDLCVGIVILWTRYDEGCIQNTEVSLDMNAAETMTEYGIQK